MSAVTNGTTKNEEKGMIVRRTHGLHKTQRDTEVLKVVLYFCTWKSIDFNFFYFLLYFLFSGIFNFLPLRFQESE